MAKKNKNKIQNQPKQPVLNKTSVSEETKLEIEAKNNELDVIEVTTLDELSQEAQSKLREAENKEDLLKYWNYVKAINKKLEGLISATEVEKDKICKLKEEQVEAKKSVEEIKLTLNKKVEDYINKDKLLTEREFALDNGEFTNVISSLLNSIKETEKKVFTDTENLILELSKLHKDNIEEFKKYAIDNAELEKRSTELEKEITEFRKEKKRFEIDKIDFEENLQDKFAFEIESKTRELNRLQIKLERIEAENTKLKALFNDFENAFETLDPESILKKLEIKQNELTRLDMDLKARPDQSELDLKQEQIEELTAKVYDLQEKVNLEEILSLKNVLNNSDSFVIEINSYKNQIESSKIRESSLKKTIKDLWITIDQLKGESTKKNEAFEFAKKWDKDAQLANRLNSLSNKKPYDLKELVEYVQQWMAYKSDKPFYYDLDTIRIFLSGLNMSSISILQGISGTGKTSLPREFSKALLSDTNYSGLDDENQNNASYRICAVQSGWRDSMDLMGYYNSFEHKYKETDFFKALYLANLPKYANTLFLIILDEMNLSRPEHYFADFLSLLEQSPDERYIAIANAPTDTYPDLIKGGRLKIPKNIRFIGTANHDETTLEFAPKTYDRSNVMEMPKNHPDLKTIKKNNNEYDISYEWLNVKFIEAENKHKKECKKFNDFINSVDMKLLLQEKGIGIGNRLEYQAEKFISVFIECGDNLTKDIAKATDHLITTRLFRTLKNRYDLDKAVLVKFKDEYNNLFRKEFKFHPQYANELLDTEISKK